MIIRDTWSPEQYERFRSQRNMPFYDLLRMVERRPEMEVVDLGCGTGELTRKLHKHVRAKHTLGLDSSKTMLAKSAKFLTEGLVFQHGEIEAFKAREKYDLVFANASLQWVDDHPRLFPRLRAALKPAGQLAVQVPANFDHPSHQVIFEIAKEEPFRTHLGGYEREVSVLTPEDYGKMLFDLGFDHQDVRQTDYLHPLGSRDEVVDWVRGTLLNDYERRLSPEVFKEFVAQYRRRLIPKLEDHQPYFYRFRRILFCGSLPA